MRPAASKIARGAIIGISVSILLLFARSYFHGDYFILTTQSTGRILFSDCCSIRYQSFANRGEAAGLRYDHVFNPFDYYAELRNAPRRVRIIGVWQFSHRLGFSLPYWPLAIPAAYVVARSLWRARRSARLRLALAILFMLWPFLFVLVLDYRFFDNDFTTLLSMGLVTLGLGWLLRDLPAALSRADTYTSLGLALNFRARRRRYRRLNRLCVECGFDLRATPERCPECGWIVVSEIAGENPPASTLHAAPP